jgi:hypothetical protein
MELFWIAPKSSHPGALAGGFQSVIPGAGGQLWLAAGRSTAPGEVWQRRTRGLEIERALVELCQDARSPEDLSARLQKRFPELAQGCLGVALLDADGALSLLVQGAPYLLIGRSAPRPVAANSPLRVAPGELAGAPFLALVEGDLPRAEALSTLLHDADHWLGAGAVYRLLLGAQTPSAESALAALRSTHAQTQPTMKAATPAPKEAPPGLPNALPWLVAGASALVALLALLLALWKPASAPANPVDTRPKLLPVTASEDEDPEPTPEPVKKPVKPSTKEPGPNDEPDNTPPKEPATPSTAPSDEPATPKETTPEKPATKPAEKKPDPSKKPKGR